MHQIDAEGFLVRVSYGQTSFDDIELANCDLSKNYFETPISITNSTLDGVNFSECMMHSSNFSGSKLTKCIFNDCDLIDSNFDNVIFSECKFDHADLSGATFENVDTLSGIICDDETWLFSKTKYVPRDVFIRTIEKDIGQTRDGRLECRELTKAINHPHIELGLLLKVMLDGNKPKPIRELAGDQYKLRKEML